jgi:hypothetical protein
MTVFVSDTFTASDGTYLEDHSPEVGDAWQSRLGNTAIEIWSNTATLRRLGKYAYYTNAATPSSAEYDITANFLKYTSGGATFGFVGRFVDGSNYYLFYYIHGDTAYYLKKRIEGVFSTLDTLVEEMPDGTNVALLEIRNNSQRGKVGGVEKVTAADSDLTDAGNVGMFFSSLTSRDWYIDDFVADDAGAPVAETAIMQPMRTWWPR